MEGIDDLEDGSISTIVCSPPYWGLRDYGDSKSIWDDDPSCHHVWSPINNKCFDCNAWLGQLGLEPTYKLYVKHLVAVFEKLKTKLRDDGTLWVNIGDTYAGGNGIGVPKGLDKKDLRKRWNINDDSFDRKNFEEVYPSFVPQSKLRKMAKSQIGIPERFKTSMIDNGWICRNTIIWHKPNPMPTSVRDRYTNDFEYFYFFSKKKDYYFKQQLEDAKSDKKRNKRTVWRIQVATLKEAHFAVFPRELVQSPIDACVPERICNNCDKPKDIVDCDCSSSYSKGIALDPFCGSGTTLIEAIEQNKYGIGIEINSEYVDIAKKRIERETTKIINTDWLDWVIEEEGGE